MDCRSACPTARNGPRTSSNSVPEGSEGCVLPINMILKQHPAEMNAYTETCMVAAERNAYTETCMVAAERNAYTDTCMA